MTTSELLKVYKYLLITDREQAASFRDEYSDDERFVQLLKIHDEAVAAALKEELARRGISSV